MAGTIRGRIDCLLNASNARNNVTDAFVHIYNLVTTIPGVTIVSLGYGTGGTGMDFHDGAAPPGDGAFFVARFAASTIGNDFWVMVILGSTTTGGGVPSPAVLFGGTTASSFYGLLGISAARGIGGDGMPYNVTTNADGTDTYAHPIMQAPSVGGTNVMGIPRSNHILSEDNTNKNNFLQIVQASSASNCRFSVVVDDDNILIAWDTGDTGSVDRITWVGRFKENPALDAAGAGYDHPIAGVSVDSNINLNSSVGNDSGGVLSPDTTLALSQAAVVMLTNPGGNATFVAAATAFPDVEGGALYTFFPIDIWALGNNQGGYRGRSDFLFCTFGMPTYDTDAGLNYMALGGSIVSENLLLPWDGTTIPQSTTNRNGVAFTTA